MCNPGQSPPQASAPSPSLGQSTTQISMPVQTQVTQTAAAPATPVVDTRAPKFERLRDDNWLAWMTRMTAVLKQKDMFDIVTGKLAKPQDPVAAKEWRNRDYVAQVLITTSIEDKQIVYVMECDTSAQMWEALRVIHEPHGIGFIVSTKCSLYCAEASEGADIPAHLNEMWVLRERLMLAGVVMAKDELKALMASSLPESWDGYTRGVLGYLGGMQGNQHAQSLTVQQLFAHICEEYNRRKQREAKEQKKRTCAICGRTNHVTNNCRFKGKRKCDICGKFGHKDEDCSKNVANKGKGRISKGRKFGKERQVVVDDSWSSF